MWFSKQRGEVPFADSRQRILTTGASRGKMDVIRAKDARIAELEAMVAALEGARKTAR